MSTSTFVEKQEDEIIRSVFSVSATMVGVCFTVIGILNVITANSKKTNLFDDFTAGDALLFLCACFISYIAMRTQDKSRRLLLEKTADIIFLVGLALMAMICCFIVYDINWCSRRI